MKYFFFRSQTIYSINQLIWMKRKKAEDFLTKKKRNMLRNHYAIFIFKSEARDKPLFFNKEYFRMWNFIYDKMFDFHHGNSFGEAWMHFIFLMEFSSNIFENIKAQNFE